MADLPAEVTAAWEERQPPVVFTTVDSNGVPNAIYATCVSIYAGSMIIIANNYFHKTLANIRDGCRGTVLFITPDRKAYQVKGTVSYHEAGPYFEDMKRWNPPHRPGHGAAVLHVEEAYSGAERLL